MDGEIERLRGEINALYEENKKDRQLTEEELSAVRSRLDRLEVQSENRDQAIEELKQAVKELQEKIQVKLEAISTQIVDLKQAPAEKLSQRWEAIVIEVVKYLAIAAVAFILFKKVG